MTDTMPLMTDTMLLAARQYVHGPSAGRPDESEQVYERTADLLSAQLAQGAIAGYHLCALRHAEDCAEELVDDDWKQLVREVYPTVYAFVQPNHADDLAFDASMTADGFTFVK